MRGQTIDDFLTDLAARVPAPGGGATAALHAAQAAALVGMVARYSDGARFAEHAEEIAGIVAGADRLRVEALRLAEADATAFTAVADAYSLPRATDDEKALRRNMIAVALKGACVPPAAVVEVAADTVVLAERLIPIGNRSVITDVAAAAEAARAAATTARVNIEVNLGGITDADNKAVLLASAHSVDLIVERAEKVTAAVRAELAA
ncbi:Formiminotetrahydrofolate cyclodeaminase [Lentzea albidocapillata subsp. violacea]|uniref:Formiminotetrahydrofolate cyclodeaminase n=1 Tax=Lentzea albidocapillata subsp. violacea TaxID=128104 RepID=A0A1G8QFU4_9PSEU|nr:cyclodeaminase/cyclohydrolase family protein [Lentzea albidocapillata]SDJ03508.1 Formiminotetrahydrofolate cyclodeaminase [Lentzea albidocapillata subsp. violacea]